MHVPEAPRGLPRPLVQIVGPPPVISQLLPARQLRRSQGPQEPEPHRPRPPQGL